MRRRNDQPKLIEPSGTPDQPALTLRSETLYLFGVTSGASCTQSCYSVYDCLYDSYIYCATGCCGSYYNRYCCSTDLNAAAIVGIVIGAFIFLALIVSFIVCLCCVCRKNRGASGTVITQGRPNVTVANVTSSYPVMPPQSMQYAQTPGYAVGQIQMTTYSHSDTAKPPPAYNQAVNQTL
ncbi:hypothetical protein FSP39_007546 [Pinctada imbricata]|uniref:Cysteine and tyrosine-rich protein 1 n=1 Tax=Pinctada imbricata TaxID=66713 RepID=A0AA88YQA8_PINIB|nr:hypothetical protein FSP39_007546 [Pinctada imbricata]